MIFRLTFFFALTVCEDVVVHTKFGFLRGERFQTRQGAHVDSFLGVPFAKSPKRLQRAEIVDPWPNIKRVQNYSAKCIPSIRPAADDGFSEDCLYLNIFAPANRDATSTFPVVIFVHGGEFAEGKKLYTQKFYNTLLGDSNDANNTEFAEKFVPEGIILVTIQYRLGALGFLTLGANSSVLTCNLGLWDQVLAFQFISETISSFGGDSQKMTLMGHSAGAMSTSFHSISPISSKFFDNYIQLSGSAWSFSRYANNNKIYSQRILKDLNCEYNSALELEECFNGKSLDELYSAQVGTALFPELGDDLLPEVNLKEFSKKNLLTGLQTLEALFFTYLKTTPKIFPYVDRSTVEDYLNTTVALRFGAEAGQALNLLSDYFIPSNISNDDYAVFMRQKTKIESNIVFDIPVLREIRDKLPFANSIFVYHFEYFNDAEFDPNFPVKATYHCQEFPYVWNVYKDNFFKFNENDKLVEKFFVSALINFIKTGNPSNENFTWPKTDDTLLHVRVLPEPVLDHGLFGSDCQFWDNLRSTLGYDFITNLKYVESASNTLPQSLMLFIFALCIYHNL
ncbi:unnamed protein product [Caenorhabditis bovis]|uniref:Carboxylic ester hydrolase n=1 Tax=Caenorhabditis bovis TaxID=2654633 RepID=A0A8S1F251_9PELO|nr:unnamed protein product [Caenorhabditis bovis]